MILHCKMNKSSTNMGYETLKVKIHMLPITSTKSTANIKTLH